MQTDSSAMATCLRLRSTVECTATVRMPSAWQARRIRNAISPRFAITTLSSMGLGIRDWGFVGGARIANGSRGVERADQCIESGERAIELVVGFGVVFAVAQALGDLQLGTDFGEGSSCHGQEAQVLGGRATGAALRDVRRYAYRRPAQLHAEAKPFLLRETGRDPIDRLHQRHRVAPYVEALVGSLLLRIPNHESPIPS